MRKKRTRSKVLHKETTPDLPQNIIPVGERVFEDKNIYIHQKVYDQIHKFSENKTENEHGGILVGRVLNEMGKENTIIEGFIEAKYNNATPTTLTFTHETWEHFHAEIDRKYKDKKIVGWIHTHPNFGIFLSENDKFIQENFFTDSNQVAYVVDPIQKEEGFYFWIEEKLERCPGFYLFDKNGVKIKQKIWNKDDTSCEEEPAKKSKLLTIILIVALVANMVATMYQGIKIRKLERQVADQDIVLEYAVFGGAYDLSFIANDIRMQIEAQRQAQQKAAEEAAKESEQESEKTENPEETPENPQENNTTEEAKGGNE